MKINPNSLPKFDREKYKQYGKEAVKQYMKDNDIKHYNKVIGKNSSDRYHLFVVNMKETSEGYQIFNFKSYCGSIYSPYHKVEFDLELGSNIVDCKFCKIIEER